MRVLILAPRLDCMFKEGPVPEVEGPPNDPIRVHWANLVKRLTEDHEEKGDTVEILKKPLWQFTPEEVCALKPDLAYIPHKEAHSFPIPDIENIDVRYYHQTVFPWRFYIDKEGWAGGASVTGEDIMNMGTSSSYNYDQLRKYTLSGGTKFAQPTERKELPEYVPESYVLFPCQIPHDETIKYHSKVSVEQALGYTIYQCRQEKKFLIVKGHPVNPGSMEPLRKICSQQGILYVDDMSIHQLLERAETVVCVNSGTGMESLLQRKNVITFGDCEYNVVTRCIEDGLTAGPPNQGLVAKFFDGWCKWTYNARLKISYTK